MSNEKKSDVSKSSNAKSAKRFKTQWNQNYKGCKGEVNTGKSKTQPDMNLSIKQLLINHSRGIPSDTSMRQGHYFETEIPNITDLNDLHDYGEKNRQSLETLEQQVAQQMHEQQEQDFDRNFDTDNDDQIQATQVDEAQPQNPQQSRKVDTKTDTRKSINRKQKTVKASRFSEIRRAILPKKEV